MAPLISVANRLIAAGERIRPLWLRKWVFATLFSVYGYFHRVQALLVQLRMPVSKVVGEGKDGGRLCLLFVGREAFSLYLGDLLFREPPRLERIGMMFVWRLRRVARMAPSDVDGVLVSCDRFYQRWLEKAGLYVFPHFVDMVLDVSDPVDVFFKKSTKSAKADIQKVRKHGYSFEVCSDVDCLRLFYERMYLPLIQTRHGDAPVYTPPFLFFRWLRLIGYRLMLVKDKQGDVIAGCFYGVNHGTAFVRYLGVIDGDIELVRKGAESAMYYFFVLHPEDPGVRATNFGGARPFFNDGLFRYKQKWGMTVGISDVTPEIFGLRLMSDGEPLREFLLNNPLIGINDKKELVGYVFVNKNTLTDALGEQYEKRFQMPGLKQVLFTPLEL
jgi:hypothetical protein